jgi:hypothetical protein
MIGEECVAFTTVSLAGPLTYALTNILRGARGSEQHVRMHQANETFVLLDTVARNASRAFAPTAIGTTRHYKAVPEGVNISAVTGQAHVMAGVSGKPWATLILSAVRDGGSGDWTLTWLHRARVRGVWVDLTGILYDTDDLRIYDLHLYTSNIFTTRVATRTLPLETDPEGERTYVYTAAQQTTDFGSTQEFLFCGIAAKVAGIPGYEGYFSSTGIFAPLERWRSDAEVEPSYPVPGWSANAEEYTWPPGTPIEAWSTDAEA